MWQRAHTDGPQLTPAELQSKAERYCAMAEHCASEVQDKLRQWGASADMASQVIDGLYDQQYLSEERYCRAFTNDKIRFQGWGREKVRAALMQKRLPSYEIQAALEAFPTEEYMVKLKTILQKKADGMGDLPDEVFQQKLLRHLLSRGFTYSEIQKALSQL